MSWDVAILTNGTYAIIGETRSSDFTTVVPIQENLTGSQEAFAAVVNEFGHLLFSTYIGGENDDLGHSCVESATGEFIMAGSTASDDLVLVDPIQENRGGSNDFLIIEFSPWISEQTDPTPMLLAVGAGGTIAIIILLVFRNKK
jgi:hypothetical protein